MRNFKRERTIILGAFGGLVVGLGAALAAAAPPAPVIVAEAVEREFTDRIEALGTLRANESVEVTANVTEVVERIGFEDGERVKQGDVLVELVQTEEEALIVEARATANEAKLQYERALQLAKSGASARSDLDESRRIYETTKARLGAIESQLTDLRIVAPFDGIVGLRNISVGTLVQPGEMITTLDDDSVMKLDFAVPSTFLSVLEAGTPVEAVTRGFGDEKFRGEISSVSSRVDPVTRAVTVRAVIPNPEQKLKPGLLMTVVIASRPRNSVAVPEEALMPQGATTAVFVIDDEVTPPVVRRREVVVGKRRAGEVEIEEGLQAGERVVTRGAMMLGDGATIQVTAVDDGKTPIGELLNGGAES